MIEHQFKGRTTAEFLRFFFAGYPIRTSVMIGLMVLAGLAESIGVVSLVPVIEVAGTSGEPTSTIGRAVFDVFSAVGVEPRLEALLTAIVIAITVKATVLYIALRQVGYTIAHVARDLRLRFMAALLHARWSFFERIPAGQYANTISSEVNRASAAYREAAQVLATSIQVVAYLAASALISWQVTALTVGVGVVLSRVFSRFFKSSRAAGEKETSYHKTLASRLVDIIQGLKPLKAMARESLVWPMLKSETDGLNKAQQDLVRAMQGRQLFYEPLVTAFLATGLYLLLGPGGQPISQVLVLAVIFYRIMQSANTIQMRYQIVLSGESAFFSLFDDIREAEAQAEGQQQDGIALSGVGSGVELRGVRFKYEDAEVLRGVDLTIPAGKFVAVTGASGSGKTTLADVLAGLRDPDDGQVLVDGQPLSTVGRHNWRRLIGYVPQELLAFNDTIFRNITLSDPDLTEDDVVRALKMAGAYEFVMERPQGLHAHVGERGGSLSGGQRQRLAIARALVWRPSLLILDEVTTALDPRTEQEICETLRGLAGSVTIFAISHQPALQKVADLAFVLERGRIASGVVGAHGNRV